MFTLQERVGSLRSRIEFKEVNEQEGRKRRNANNSSKPGCVTFLRSLKKNSGKKIALIWSQ